MSRPFRLSASCAVVLSACGGASGVAEGPDPLTATIRLAAFDTLVSRFEDQDFTVTAPSSGTATYRGYAAATADLGSGSGVYVLGDAVLTARFAEETILGNLDHFITDEGLKVPGSATIANGRIGLTGFTADVSGSFTLTGEGYTLDATLEGAFLGPVAAGLTGLLDGTLRRGGLTAGTVTGELWAQR